MENPTIHPGPAVAPLGPTAGDYPYVDDVHEYILRMIPEDGKVIGSIGCGRGNTEAVLVRGGREVHGVDISTEAVEVARTRMTSARVISPDDRRPFDDASLDGLILADVIEHIPATWDALTSFSRAVRPGGWVVISVPNMRNINVVAQFMLLGDWPEKPMGIFDRTHLQVMSRRRLSRWCAGASLNVERWFDRYEEHRWRGRMARVLDPLTLRLFHEFLTYQLQSRCRKQP
jgi:2-polyprenyl-3-methyl-5-hydroxy-6-metoxy-1,4-benzoquinol methylase